MTLPECIKKALAAPEWAVDIQPSEGHYFNGFFVSADGYSEFRAGLWWDFMSHLEKCRSCRKELKYNLKNVRKALRRCQMEWAYLTHST